ncbi:S8/S53 family peptidase [Occultella gossypii]|uniref:S8/S53 family peptidase n=1 Tax=Occultella gossypii TaxID=2800820 RepID=A0ABS7SDF7_9MICO|nr:S8/S53 family peptidase [Occultella gossypii]MBZ2198374.1 S8/S53 family peptidase [Occultella gossypii]
MSQNTPGEANVPLVSEPPIGLPNASWERYRARVLDPSSAVQRAEEVALHPTVYSVDSVLIRGGAVEGALKALGSIARELGLGLVEDDEARAEREFLGRPEFGPEERGLIEENWVESARVVRLDPAAPAEPVDAWRLVQAYRAATGRADEVSLDHLVFSATDIGGTPYTIPHVAGGAPHDISSSGGGTPYTIPHSNNGLSTYAMPGSGGRQPVAWLGPEPAPRNDPKVRRPVVAVLDTGVGEHPWLGSDVVIRDPEVLGLPLGLPRLVPDTEETGTANPLVGGLEADAGHGTFIAGLIRQQSADARILSVRVFRGDGVVAESQLVRSLRRLVLWQVVAMAAGDPEMPPVDVLSLSLGYYHEQPADLAFDPLLWLPLKALGALGVTVVAASGNDATTREMFPAAFADYPGGPPRTAPEALPLQAVGALNPNGSTVALFSNEGPWVLHRRVGAGLVSTFPTTINTSLNPVASLAHEGRTRASIDPDDFASGFATWSGTSFAAPVFAGEVAAALADLYAGGADSTKAADAVERGRKALANLPGARAADGGGSR